MQDSLSGMTLSTMPTIELGYIFNFLDWKDKLNLQEAFPEMSRILTTTYAWKTFSAGKQKDLQRSKEEVACVQRYGHLFQHCILWLGRPCRTSWECTCLFDSLFMDSVFPVLASLVDKCKVMTSLRLYHPSHVTPESDDTQIFKQYQRAIDKLLMYALCKRTFRLELCGLQYPNEQIRPISLRFLDYYISNPQALDMVTVLDVSGNADGRLHPVLPLFCLQAMPSLVTLKVPIHCITMATIQCVVLKSLQNLYLLSNDRTVDLSHFELKHFDWLHLHVPHAQNFGVHYIFKQRVIRDTDFVVNPFVRSICLDSLCKPLTDDLLLVMADRYGKSLELFALVHSAWMPSLRVSDFSQFARLCPRLTHFICTVPCNQYLLLSLVQQAQQLKQVLVVKHQKDEFTDIIPFMSKHLQCQWKPHLSPATFHLLGWELPFLLDEYTLRC